ncbi:MAG: heptosyltransferase [Bacteroidetes bacterium GWF2_38_335]|nr:MAG: heptosyltransferase [Bacteroidetes bacterium GWF2_38_335]OFY79171.1 MAG: heptosyltransferase [Bacteroidetes bacterium RIFOXYA12_FULL_38_20]HBS86135.1 heptosyltransferase [Bacteroidales bacterium]
MKILIIQTAFIGDVILATPLVEALNKKYPGSNIDFLLRKGNEGLLEQHPKISNILIWDKKKNKLRNLFNLIRKVRSEKYDMVYNLHRFASSGLITLFSSARVKAGFDKNPFSFSYSKTIRHIIGDSHHEADRNLELVDMSLENTGLKPKLYPCQDHFEKTAVYKSKPYIVVAPASVWFTKRMPEDKWIQLFEKFSGNYMIYMIGGKEDKEEYEKMILKSGFGSVVNLAGKLSFLESAALMKDAAMNFVNDSAPLHIASSVNAPVTAFFCSTIPDFGFGPLSDKSVVQQVSGLKCKPCGLHGKRECPEKHFRCGNEMDINNLTV